MTPSDKVHFVLWFLWMAFTILLQDALENTVPLPVMSVADGSTEMRNAIMSRRHLPVWSEACGHSECWWPSEGERLRQIGAQGELVEAAEKPSRCVPLLPGRVFVGGLMTSNIIVYYWLPVLVESNHVPDAHYHQCTSELTKINLDKTRLPFTGNTRTSL